MKRFALLLSIAVSAFAQSDLQRHTITMGVGAYTPVSGYLLNDYDTGVAMSASYGYRLHKFVQAEVGYTGAVPLRTEYSKWFSAEERTHVSTMDYGIRGVLPLNNDRLQLSAGVGGGYVWHEYDSYFKNGNMLQYSGRVSYALDRNQNFRAGVTVRLWRDLGRPTQQWVTTTADISYAFGRR